MNDQGTVRISTSIRSKDREFVRTCSANLYGGGNPAFHIVEFDKNIAEMIQAARESLIAEFGEPRGYVNPWPTRESHQALKDRIAEQQREIERHRGEIERLEAQLDERNAPPPAGGGTASAWYQGISNALGVGPGGLNLKLEDCKSAIGVLKERSATLRKIEEVHKRNAWAENVMIDGKPI